MNARQIRPLFVVLLLGGCATTSLNRVDQDSETRQRLTKIAEQGHAEAQYELGLAYCCGTGFYNTTEAIKWWCRAALQGHALAAQKLRQHLSSGIADGCRRYVPASDQSDAQSSRR